MKGAKTIIMMALIMLSFVFGAMSNDRKDIGIVKDNTEVKFVEAVKVQTEKTYDQLEQFVVLNDDVLYVGEVLEEVVILGNITVPERYLERCQMEEIPVPSTQLEVQEIELRQSVEIFLS